MASRRPPTAASTPPGGACALVVFETPLQEAGTGVATGLSSAGLTVHVGSVDQVDPRDVAWCDLLVVGTGATSFRIMRTERSAPPLTLLAWLMAASLHPRLAATFETRLIRTVPRGRSAACQAALLLHHRGYELAGPPMSFQLDAVHGGLALGERDRAERWGSGLAEAVAARTHGDAVAWWRATEAP